MKVYLAALCCAALAPSCTKDIESYDQVDNGTGAAGTRSGEADAAAAVDAIVLGPSDDLTVDAGRFAGKVVQASGTVAELITPRIVRIDYDGAGGNKSLVALNLNEDLPNLGLGERVMTVGTMQAYDPATMAGGDPSLGAQPILVVKRFQVVPE